MSEQQNGSYREIRPGEEIHLSAGAASKKPQQPQEKRQFVPQAVKQDQKTTIKQSELVLRLVIEH